MRAENARAMMQNVRWLMIVLLVAVPSFAHADLLRRALDGVDPGGGAGSGSGSASSQQEDDLVTWAGEAKPITLPELLQMAIRQAPALANAKLDIAVAEAQVAETWARHDWTLGSQITVSKSGSSVFSGIELQGSTTATAYVDISRVLPTGGTIDFKVDT